MNRIAPLLLLTLLLGLAPPAAAQFVPNPTEVRATGIPYRMYARPGEPTIQVQMLGEIASGIYVVGTTTNLGDLLVMAGGANLSEGSPNVERTVTIRLMRQRGDIREVVYESDVHRMLREPGAYPTLQDGDLITVTSTVRPRYTFRETIGLVSSLASITLLLLRLTERI
jgi:hypothetical protein